MKIIMISYYKKATVDTDTYCNWNDDDDDDDDDNS